MGMPSALVRVPASTANLGPGFDSLGMALSLYTWIGMRESQETVITLHGDGLGGIPGDKNNLVYKVAQLLFAEAGISMPELEIDMYSDIPLTRGLGSSASAIIGALVAANASSRAIRWTRTACSRLPRGWKDIPTMSAPRCSAALLPQLGTGSARRRCGSSLRQNCKRS